MNTIKNSDFLTTQLGSLFVNSPTDIFLSDDPFLILNSNFDIVFFNNTFKYSAFYDHFIFPEDKNLNKLKNDLQLFASSSFNFSTLNYLIEEKERNQFAEYQININRIKFPDNELYLLKFSDATKLLERENRIVSIQTALEMMKTPVMITSSKGNIIYISEEFENTFDLDIESVYNKFFCLAFENILNKEDLLSLENAFLNNQPWAKSIQIKSKNGLTSHKEIKFIPSARLINGEKLSLVIVYDITTHIEERLEVEASLEKMNLILDSIAEPIFIIKDNKNFLSLERGNKGFYELFSCNQTNIGSNIELLIDKELFNVIKNHIGLFQNSDIRTKDFEYSFNGNFFKARIVSLLTATKEKIYIVTLNNITFEIEYQKKIKSAFKKELELNRLKGAFIENISHEIRTPFHAISGYSDIIDESLNNEDYGTVKEITSLLKDVLERVTRLFDNIIELSHLESKEMIFEFSNINPNKVVKSLYDKLIRKAIDKGIQLLLDMGDFKKQIHVDVSKLEKILFSLIDNSIKYTHYGNVVVRTYHQNNKIFISVTDTGEGMNQNEIDELLQPFGQEENTFTRKYQGMGLGLTIAYRLTKLMGGDVEIISQKSIGTKVILSFNIIEID